MANKGTNPKYIKEVIELTNKERQRFGLPPLEENKKLNKAAQSHSKNMAYGLDRWAPIQATSYNGDIVARNTAYYNPTPEYVIEFWMDYDRENILSSSALEVGVGSFLKPESDWWDFSWTQLFGYPSDAPQIQFDNEVLGSYDNERLQGSNGKDEIIGGQGNDTIKGRGGDDNLLASEGNDLLYGGGGNDTIIGNYDIDTLYGGNGNDYLSSWTEQFTIMNGGNGNDYLDSGYGDDILKGGNGKDLIFGNGGDDTIEGGNGTDGLSGNSGNDYLIGGKGNDVLWGDGGSDTLIGVAPKAAHPGKKERDTFTGGNCNDNDVKDVFILGDRQKVFYDDGNKNNPGKGDYALIRRFETDADIIQLHGKANDYLLKNSPRGMPDGIAIFLDTAGKDELIGIVADVSDLDIKGDYFKFV